MHRSILLLAALALAACSSSAPDDNASASPTAESTIAPANAVAPGTPQAELRTRTPPEPGALKTFGDWAVGCDNSGACTMASLGPEGGEFSAINLTLARDAGPAGAITVTLIPNDGLAPASAPASVAIDGTAVPATFSRGAAPELSGGAAAGLAAAMANGRRLAIRGGDGRSLASLSLRGASAALRYIDAQQGRAGTVTAVVAKGAAPASNVPAGPALPQIVTVEPAGKPFAPSAAMVATMKRQAQCDDSAHGDLETHTIGADTSLILLPCSAGAYNLISAVFVAKAGEVSPARMDAPSGFTEGDAPAAVPMVVNATYDKGVLTSFAEGRGLGDCGVRQNFVWDGGMFRLSRQEEMGECRGDPNYITTWVAKVVRR